MLQVGLLTNWYLKKWQELYIDMSFGKVIRMHSGWGYKTPNSGVLRDLETGIEYSFKRESATGSGDSGKVPRWNVELYDGVSFDIEGSIATNVTLVRKHKKGSTFAIVT
jgi:hypothetical protein